MSTPYHWTKSKVKFNCPECGQPTTHYRHRMLKKTRRIIMSHNGIDGLLCPKSGSFIDVE